VVLLLTEGQASDHRGAAIMLPRLPPARGLIADRGYDSARFRAALQDRGIAPVQGLALNPLDALA
jgi:putative transposase